MSLSLSSCGKVVLFTEQQQPKQQDVSQLVEEALNRFGIEAGDRDARRSTAHVPGASEQRKNGKHHNHHKKKWKRKKILDFIPSQLIDPKYFASVLHNLCWFLTRVDLGHSNLHFHSRVEGLAKHPVEVVVSLDDLLFGVVCVPVESTPQQSDNHQKKRQRQ